LFYIRPLCIPNEIREITDPPPITRYENIYIYVIFLNKMLDWIARTRVNFTGVYEQMNEYVYVGIQVGMAKRKRLITSAVSNQDPNIGV